MDNIKLFESFVSEEDSNIYGSGEMTSDSAASPKELELKKGVVKTWINDYVIPFMDYYAQDWNTVEKDPKFKAFVSKAKAWLRKPSGIPERSRFTDEIVGTYPNSSIVYLTLYQPKEIAALNKGKYPIIASFYEDLD